MVTVYDKDMIRLAFRAKGSIKCAAFKHLMTHIGWSFLSSIYRMYISNIALPKDNHTTKVGLFFKGYLVWQSWTCCGHLLSFCSSWIVQSIARDKLSEEEVDHLISEADKDGDVFLKYEEFEKILTAEWKKIMNNTHKT